MGWEGCSRGHWAVGTGPLRLQQCRISWFEILVLEGTGVLCPRATWCQGAGVLAGGGMLSGGMRIAPHVSFSQKAGQLTAEQGWGVGSL